MGKVVEAKALRECGVKYVVRLKKFDRQRYVYQVEPFSGEAQLFAFKTKEELFYHIEMNHLMNGTLPHGNVVKNG